MAASVQSPVAYPLTRAEALRRLLHWLRSDVPGAYCHPAVGHTLGCQGWNIFVQKIVSLTF